MLILSSKLRKELLCLLFPAHVHERNLRSKSSDFGALLADIRNRRRAVRSTKVTQEDQQQWTLLAKCCKGRALLGYVLSERIGDGHVFRMKMCEGYSI
jgi:hypothetical protein